MSDAKNSLPTKPVKVNLGSGSVVIEEWINVDYSLGSRLSKVPFFPAINKKFKFFNIDWSEDIFLHDLRKKFPWEDETIDIIYSSHTLEHLNKPDGLNFLKECYRVLKSDGVIRIVVPDLKSVVSDYLNGSIAADDFVDVLGVIEERHDLTNPIKKGLAYLTNFPHRCMYDTETLIRKMSEIGFKVFSKNPFESAIPNIDAIELKDRTENAVIVEGGK